MSPRRNREPATGQVPGHEHGRPVVELHPVVIDIAFGATIFAIICIWLTFGWTMEIDYLLAVVSVFAIIFFAIFLFAISHISTDPRWQQRHTSFSRFLKDRVALPQGRVSGREALLQVALLPVILALAFAAIGLIWVLVR